MKIKKDKNQKNVEISNKNKYCILQLHERKLNSFQDKTGRINEVELKIKKLKKENEKHKNDYDVIQIEKLKHKEKLSCCNICFMCCCILCTERLKSKINQNNEKIKKLLEEKILIESGNDETQYILDSMHIIIKYSDLVNKENVLLSSSNMTQPLLDELNNISSLKNELIIEYNNIFNYGKQINYIIPSYNIDNICKTCNIEYTVSEGHTVCTNCGLCAVTVEFSNTVSYKDLQSYEFKPQFTYEKISHLEDWLRRFEAKDQKVIPQTVIDLIIVEANKEKITNLNDLSEEKVKKYLKKLSLTQYYDNVISIINRINGRKPFTLTPDIEDKIKNMFLQIQEPFNRHKPKNRKNFLSYSYTLHKLFQILDLHEISCYFPLLKNIDKLRLQDETFKKIVEEMALKDKTTNWRFIPSI